MAKRRAKNEITPDFDGFRVFLSKRSKSNSSSSPGHSQANYGQVLQQNAPGLGSNTHPIVVDSAEDMGVATSAGQAWKLPLEQAQEWRQSGVKKVYCVRNGHRPGFYPQWYGTEGAEKQVKGFSNCAYRSFSMINNLEKSIRDAEEYMNRTPGACKIPGQPAKPQSFRTVASPMQVQKKQSTNHMVQSTGGNVDYGSSSSSSKQSTTGSGESQDLSTPGPTYNIKDKCLCMHCQKKPLPGERLCCECLESPDMLSRIELIATEFRLVDEQKRLLELAACGKNLFFTGAAGTGKSTVLRAIVSLLRNSGLNAKVVAPTGIAALGLELNATTLHTYAGWDPESAKKPLKDLRKRAGEKQIWKRFNQTDVLIIDEISMVSSHMLTRLAAIMDEAIGQGTECPPFGGVQLIVTGDFFQLPPVKPFETCTDCDEDLIEEERQRAVHRCIKFACSCDRHGDCHQAIPDTEKWAFRSPVWDNCKFKNVELQEIHRQADPYFANILNRVRRGKGLAPEDMKALRVEKKGVKFDDAVKLYPKKWQVKRVNEGHMGQLPSPVRRFPCIDGIRRSDTDKLTESTQTLLGRLEHHRYERNLDLKKDMKVLLVQNLDSEAGLANGSRGTIVGFETDSAGMDVQRLPQKHREFAQEQIAKFRARATDNSWPIVMFHNGVQRTIYPHPAISEIGQNKPYTLLSRTQIPLIAGWAMTVHKAQGMTLDNVIADSNECFAPGQTYVALSRAKKLSGMRVMGQLSDRTLLPDQTVKDFMETTFPA